MRKLYTLLLIFMVGMFSRAEEESLVRESFSLDLQVRQKPGTERLLPRPAGMTPMGYGLRTDGGSTEPFCFFRKADGGYLVRVWNM